MRLRNLWLLAGAGVALTAFSACKPDNTLTVDNVDQPDVARAFATPDGIEAILRSGFSQILGATHSTTTAILPAALVGIDYFTFPNLRTFTLQVSTAF